MKIVFLFLFLFATNLIFSQSKIPKFEDYQVKEKFSGKVVKLNPSEIKKLNEIKLSNGDTPLDYITYKSNFASKYEIVQWSCGVSCRQAIVINLETGIIIGDISSCYGLDFRIDSSLIKTNDEDDELCSVKYFLLREDKIVHFENN